MSTKEEQRKERRKNYMRNYWNTDEGKVMRKRYRQAYYDRTTHLSNGKKRKWTEYEIDILMNFKGTDEELAYKIKRSVKAIQMKRFKLKEEEMKCD